MNRYTQAADDLRRKAETGIISNGDAVDALHGLAMDLCCDFSLTTRDAEVAMNHINGLQEELGITQEQAQVYSDDVCRAMVAMMLQELNGGRI